MTKVVTRLFDSHTEALAAVRDLEAAGIKHDRISLIASNADRWHGADDNDDTAEGAAKGATTGGLLGGGAGLLAGLGMLAIPGLGPVVAAGWLVSTAAGAAVGALAGGATGGILGALKDAGHSDDEAQVYAEGVRRGGSLVSVRPADSDEAAIASRVLTDRGVSAAERGRSYREAGWSRFDETAEPYSSDQIAAERSRYREARSFTADSGDRSVTGERLDPAPSRPSDPDLRRM
jgi:hypothetical protein